MTGDRETDRDYMERLFEEARQDGERRMAEQEAQVTAAQESKPAHLKPDCTGWANVPFWFAWFVWCSALVIPATGLALFLQEQLPLSNLLTAFLAVLLCVSASLVCTVVSRYRMRHCIEEVF